MTPERLRQKERAIVALQGISSLRTVAGNHGRFLFDFSPEVIVFRITDDPAPRLLYCFDTPDDGKTVSALALLKRIQNGDVAPEELIVGTGDVDDSLSREFKKLKVAVLGVKAATEAACTALKNKLA